MEIFLILHRKKVQAMMKFSQRQNFLIRCLCGIFAVICIGSLFLPHLHQCEDMKCPVCPLVSLWKQLWLPDSVLFAAFYAAILLPVPECEPAIWKGYSLVRLKVKLSD